MDISTLTTYEDLQLAEVEIVIHRKLNNNVTVRRHATATLQGDGCTRWNGARISTTHVVIQQGGLCDVG